MTTDQWLTAGIPLAAVLLGILRNEFAIANVNRNIDSVERHVKDRVDSLEKVMEARFEASHQSLLRVEQVMDARLKHLEEDQKR